MSAAVDTAPVRPVPAPPHPGASVAGDGPGRGQLRWLPGVALAFTVSAAAQLAHRGAPLINAVHVCILLGALAGNLGRLPAALAPGLAVAARRVLRIGIVLLGLQLSLGQPCARSGGRRARGRSCCSGCSSRSGSGC
ncbi:MAG: putative sulfate exporter family transporter [Tetrasphaera sp.]